jgi:Flp pilus assembly protein TadB
MTHADDDTKKINKILDEEGWRYDTKKQRKARVAEFKRDRKQYYKAQRAERERDKREAEQRLYESETKEERKARESERAQKRRQSLKDSLLNAWSFIIFIVVIVFVGLIWSTISVALFGDCGTTEQCENQQQQWEDSPRGF